MEPKLMNCCKPEQVGTKEYGKIVKRIQVIEDGRIPAKEARNQAKEACVSLQEYEAESVSTC